MTAPDGGSLVASVRRVHGRAAGAAGRAAAATALIPSTCEGTDPTGAVSVTLDADGLPTAVRVAADWPRRLGPDAFGAAVTAACRAAQYARLDEWGDRLSRQPLPRQPLPRATPDTPTRPEAVKTAETAHDLQRRLRDAASAPAAGTTSTGRDATGRLSLTIGPDGLRECTADPRWVTDRSAARLATAVGEAVRAARASRADVGPSTSDTLRGIADDAIALLDDLAGTPRRAAR